MAVNRCLVQGYLGREENSPNIRSSVRLTQRKRFLDTVFSSLFENRQKEKEKKKVRRFIFLKRCDKQTKKDEKEDKSRMSVGKGKTIRKEETAPEGHALRGEILSE